jgi:cation transport ATPase
MKTHSWFEMVRTWFLWFALMLAGLSFVLLAFAVGCLGTGDQSTVRHIIVLGITFLTSAATCARFLILPALRSKAELARRLRELAGSDR